MANLLIDRTLTHVSYAGGKLDVNDVEFEILWTLVNKPGRCFTADDLIYLVNPFGQTQKSVIRIALESLAVKLAPWISFDQGRGIVYRRA